MKEIKGMVEHDFQLEGDERYWQAMQEAGVQWLRLDFSWSYIQPSSIEWIWNRYDINIAFAKKYGIKILGMLCTSPSWANGGHPCSSDTNQDSWYVPKNLEYYATFVTETVKRYKDYVNYWEVWNEVNSAGFWRDSKVDGDDASGYVTLLKTAFKAAKAEDPSCKIVFAGLVDYGMKRFKNWWPIGNRLTDQLGYIKDAYGAGAKPYFDIMAIHPYRGESPNEKKWYMCNGLPVRWTIKDGLKAVHKIMEDRGDGGKKIWLTELGWEVEDVGSAILQSKYLREAYDLCNQLDYLDKIFWYELKDDAKAESGKFWTWGILNNDFTKKNSFVTYKAIK